MDNQKFQIVQWNVRESFLKEEDTFKLKNYNIIRYDRPSVKGGGIVFLIKKPIRYEIIEHNLILNLIEIGVISIETQLGIITLFAYYRSPTHVPGNTLLGNWQKEWDSLVNQISKYEKFIFLGDFNAHNSWWGSNHTCPYGQYMEDNLDPSYFTLLNNGSPTHINITGNAYSTSHIDLTFVSPNLYADISEWLVLDDSWGSDHFPIVTSLFTQIEQYSKIDYRYNLRKLNWEVFHNELEQDKFIFNKLNYLNAIVTDKYDIFVKTVNDCIEKSIPKKSNSKKSFKTSNNIPKPYCCWWNENCDRAVRIRKARLKSLEYHCDLQKFIEYKKLKQNDKNVCYMV
uniref:Endonuclease/exonuclease/phosphatase domain-containing protein n=1 Tax=Trichogramma kaykai TaxID=54128 RepID=A0ABD2WF68_9HYME